MRKVMYIKGLFFWVGLGSLSFLCSVFCAEALLRVIGEKPSYANPERKIFWRYDSLLGWHHQPGQKGIFEKPQIFKTTVSINSKGLRDQEYSYARTPGTSRILVLGDSFTWGFGVEQHEIFTELLENMFDDVEVINAGVSGYSTDQEFLWFKTEGIRYTPDLVILVFCGNDHYMNSLDLVYGIYHKPKFIFDSKEQLLLHNVPVPTVSFSRKLRFQLRQYSALFNYINVKSGAALSSNGRHTKPSIEPFRLTSKLVGEIRNLADTTSARFIIVANDKYWNTTDNYADFIHSLQANGFVVLDIASHTGYSDKRMQLPNDEHWNNVGHRFVANELFQFIADNRLLKNKHSL